MPGGYNALMAYPPRDKEDSSFSFFDSEVVPGTRGTIFPAAQYDDGKYHLAWPGLIAQPIEGFNALWERGDEANITNPDALAQSSRESFDAAGLAATGGLAAGMVGAVPEGAVAANGVGARVKGLFGRAETPPATQNFVHPPIEPESTIRAWHASPNSFEKFDPAFSQSGDGVATGTGGNGGLNGAFFFGGPEISGPDGGLTKAVRVADQGRLHSGTSTGPGNAHVYEVEIDGSGPGKVLDMRLPFEAQPPEVQRALMANEDAVRDWYHPESTLTFGGKPFDRNNPSQLAGRALVAARDPGMAIENLRAGSSTNKVFGQAADILSAGNGAEMPDLFTPGVPIGKQYNLSIPENVGKFGFDVARNFEEIAVLNPDRIKILTRNGKPIYANSPTGASVPLALNAMERARGSRFWPEWGDAHPERATYFVADEEARAAWRDAVSRVQQQNPHFTPQQAQSAAMQADPEAGQMLQLARRALLENHKGRPLTKGEEVWESLDRPPGSPDATPQELMDTTVRENFMVLGHPELGRKKISGPDTFANHPFASASPLAFTDYEDQQNALMPSSLSKKEKDHHSLTQPRTASGQFTR